MFPQDREHRAQRRRIHAAGNAKTAAYTEFQFQRSTRATVRSVSRHQREAHWCLLTQPLLPGVKRLLGQSSLSTEAAYRLAARNLLLNHITPVLAARDGSV